MNYDYNKIIFKELVMKKNKDQDGNDKQKCGEAEENDMQTGDLFIAYLI